VEPGETIVVDTMDSDSGLVRSENDTHVYTPEELRLRGIGGYNPVTGPIYVEGVEPGDNLVVELKEIRCGGALRQGFSEITPGFGGLSGRYSVVSPLPRRVKICPIRGDVVIFPLKSGREIEIPIKPILGTIGVAPSIGCIATFNHDQEVCGNVDSPDAVAGNRIILRANVRGGLLSIGDVAVVTGDGELCGSHIDTEGEVTLKVDVVKKNDAKYNAWPQIDYPDRIGSIGCPSEGTLDDAYKTAYLDLTQRLARFYGFDILDAYQLLSAVGEVSVNQGIDPNMYSCTARVQKKYIS
jgi:amidase